MTNRLSTIGEPSEILVSSPLDGVYHGKEKPLGTTWNSKIFPAVPFVRNESVWAGCSISATLRPTSRNYLVIPMHWASAPSPS